MDETKNNLREKTDELQKKYDELLEKYNREILKISKPKLSQELEDLLCKRVCDLGLSSRASKGLDSREIIYLFQLAMYTKDDLNRIRNIGKKTIKEIAEFLREKTLSPGLNFSQEEINYFWEKIEGKNLAK